MAQLILGSTSPRRKEILNFFSLPFTTESPLFDEESVIFNGNPVIYAQDIARGKLKELNNRFPEKLILTSDTVVFCDGKIYNKPKDEKEAFAALTELQGRWHSVFTALSLSNGEEIFEGIEETKVLFNPLTPNEIRHYHSKIHWADKAGSYAIQMGAGLIVNKIDGCYYNVMGLPINTLRSLLRNVQIELWDYVR
jgi:septum formation protein